jgi:cytidylate kinase
VVEGRDTGSVVFPDADVKFYLDADIGERARRRYLELKAENPDTDIRTVERQIAQRDRDDSERAIAPLIRPEGAIVIDTTGRTIDDVVDLMREYVKKAEQ